MKYLLKLTGICLAVVAGSQLCNAGAFEDVKGAPFDSGIYQPAQLFNDYTNIYGMRLSLFMTENKDVYGLDAGLVNLSRNAFGMQVSGANIVDKDNTGLAFGIFNSAGNRLFGGQFGLYNQSGMNYFDKTIRKECTSKGFQIGWMNHVQAIFKGCQLGVANISDSYFSGVQLGIGNFVQNDDNSFEDYDTVATTEAQISALEKAGTKKADANPPDKKADDIKVADKKAEAKSPEEKKIEYIKTPFTFQMGLINFNPKGFLPVFPLFNFSW
ncbi:MAG: hypothetical protein WCI51_01370 [Lentisphaerota bacterium]